MAWYPGGKRRQISHNFTNTTTSKNAVILHTTASASATSMYSWFNNPGANASSHFHVDIYGNVEQYIDTAKRSWASGDGNSRSVSIETQGDGTEPWTRSQLTALVKLVDWICDTHSIAKSQMSNSDDRGIGWHRLGVDGNFPGGLLGGRKQLGGSQKWSSAYGKVCPGTERIKQMPDLIDQVSGKQSAASSGGSGKSSSSGHNKPWPKADLTVVGKHNRYTHKAWVKLLTDVGHKGAGKDLTRAMQNWLRKLIDKSTGKPYYGGYIDSKFGPLTTKALQHFLKDKGLYKGRIDGDRGSMTVKAEVRYLNSQRKYY